MRLWTQGQSWFNALTFRERLLILITVLTFLLLPGYVLFVEPVLIEQKTLQMKIARLQSANREKQQDINTLQMQPGSNTDAMLNLKIQQLQQQLASQESTAQSDRLVNPQDAIAMLHALLAEGEALRIISLSKIQATPVHLANNDEANKEQINSLYHHPIEMVIKGDTKNLMAYLATLEALPQRLFVDHVTWRYGKGDNAELELRLHTLATSANWLGEQS